jgi:predicted transposase YdaD
MIQSAAYEIIKEDGRKEGLQEGLEKGLEKGLKKGLYDAISFGLELKFGDKGINLMKKVTKVKSIEKLELIKNTIRTNNKLEDIEKLI